MPELTEEFIVKEATPRILKKIAILATQKVKELCPKMIGTLRDSIDYVIDEDTGTIHIGTNLDYAPIMEYGRRPGTMPPVEPLERWARFRGMPEGTGWAVAMSMKKKGIKTGTPEAPLKTESGYRPYLRPGIFKSKEDIKRVIAEEMSHP